MANTKSTKAVKKLTPSTNPSGRNSLQSKATAQKANKPAMKASTAKAKLEVKQLVKNQKKATNAKPEPSGAKKELSGLSVKLKGDGISIRWSNISARLFNSLTKKVNLMERVVWDNFCKDCNEIMGGYVKESCHVEFDHKTLIPTDFNQMLIGTKAHQEFMQANANKKQKLIPISASQQPNCTIKIEATSGEYLLVRVESLKGTYDSMRNPDGKIIRESDFDIIITGVALPDATFNIASLVPKDANRLVDDGDMNYVGGSRYDWIVFDPTGKRYSVKFKVLPKTRCSGFVLPPWYSPYTGKRQREK